MSSLSIADRISKVVLFPQVIITMKFSITSLVLSFVVVAQLLYAEESVHETSPAATEHAVSEPKPEADQHSAKEPEASDAPDTVESTPKKQAEKSSELETGHSEALDAVLLLDSSGSMLATDPQKLRYEGVRLFIQTLRKDDRLAIVEFSKDAKLVRALTQVSPDDSQNIFAEISRIENQGIYTDILAGINFAYTLLEEQKREGASRTIILLSDGKMEPDPLIGIADFRTRELLDSVLPNLKAKEIKVHSLYFSDLADKQLLAEIANGTNGLNWFTPSAATIHQSYTNLFLAVKKPQVLPLTKKGFRIDANITEATFYLNREDGAGIILRPPSGEEITSNTQNPSVKWYSGQKFDVVTVNKPEVGDWQLEGLVSEDAFATVLTDLKLVSDWSANIFSASKTLLQARLYEADKPVVLPEMTGAAQYAFRITPTDKVSEPIIKDFLVDDGTKGDKIANDGIFSSEVQIDEPGEYKLVLLLRAPTFERTQQIPFRVKPRFVSLSVYEPEEEGAAPIKDEKHKEEAEAGHEEAEKPEKKEAATVKYFRIDISPEASAMTDHKIKLVVTDPQDVKYELPVTREPGKGIVYMAPTNRLTKGVDYEVQATFTGKAKRAVVNEQSNVLHFMHAEESPSESELKLIVEAPPEVEEEKTPHSWPWWPFALAIALINAGLGYSLVQKLKKSDTTVSFTIPEFPEAKEFAKAIENLQAKAALTEISLDDPILAENGASAPPSFRAQAAEEQSNGAGAEAQGEEQVSEGEASAGEESSPAAESPEAQAAEGESSQATENSEDQETQS